MLEKLKKTRESFGLSREDVSRAIGISPSQYERIEMERPVRLKDSNKVYKIRFDQAQKLYKLFLNLARTRNRFFDIDLDDLFK